MEKNKRIIRILLITALALLLTLAAALPALRLAPASPPPPEEPEAHEEEAVILPDETTPTPTPIPHYDPSMTGEEGWVQADGKIFYLRGGGAVTGLRLIDGKYYYFDRNGVKAAAVGVDVSTYNEVIDWERARDQGIGFAIIRVGGRGWTSGSIYGDVRAEGYLRGARKAGLRIGVYFYSTAVTEAEAAQEADTVIRVLRGRKLDLPVFYDVELSGEFPKGRADRLSPTERTRLAQVFCERIRAAGYEPGVYSGQYFYQYSIHFRPLDSFSIWMANYTADGFPPSFKGEYQLWQFTDRGDVDGIYTGVDMSILFSKDLPGKKR